LRRRHCIVRFLTYLKVDQEALELAKVSVK
jgi:hypothetical protein